MHVLSYIYMHTHVHRHGRIYIYIHVLIFFWGFGIFAYITTFYIDLPELSITNVSCELGMGKFPIHPVYMHTWAPAFHHCWHLKQIQEFFLSMWFESKNPVHETIPYVSHVILFNQFKPDGLIRIALHLPYDRKSPVLFSKKETLTTSDLPPPWALNTCCGLEAISSCERGAICSGLSDL